MATELAAIVETIPDSFQSSQLELNHIKWSFVAGIAFFLLSLPYCRSRKSFFDAIAARKVSKMFRTLVFAELICLCVLLVQYIGNGNPVILHAALDYGNGDSWVFGYGRPSAGVIFIGLGLFGALLPIPRLLCMLGCLVQIVGDGLSAYQVRDYYRQVKFDAAPGHGYSQHGLLVYYWRDVVSLGLCTAVLLYAGYLSCIVGWCDPQLIHPSQVTGQGLDRFSVLHDQRDKRKYMERVGIVEAPLLPTFHRRIEDFKATDDVEKGGEEEDEKGEEKSDKPPLMMPVDVEAQGAGKAPEAADHGAEGHDYIF